MAQLEAADSDNLTERREREREPSDEQETLHTVKKVSEKVGERGVGMKGGVPYERMPARLNPMGL